MWVGMFDPCLPEPAWLHYTLTGSRLGTRVANPWLPIRGSLPDLSIESGSSCSNRQHDPFHLKAPSRSYIEQARQHSLSRGKAHFCLVKEPLGACESGDYETEGAPCCRQRMRRTTAYSLGVQAGAGSSFISAAAIGAI